MALYFVGVFIEIGCVHIAFLHRSARQDTTFATECKVGPSGLYF